MVARAARLLLLLQLLVALAIGFGLQHAFGDGVAMAAWLAGAGGLLAVLGIRALIAANNFRLAARHAGPERPPALGRADALALYLRELAATLRSSSWDMPFRPVGGPHVHRSSPLPPVLLIHGYGCNSGYWRSLHRHLETAGISHHAIDLEPVFAGIDEYVPPVAAAVEALCRATGQSRVVVIGHSMGGLVARAWVRACGPDRLRRLITLGTPHHGTALAAFAPGENSKQMRRGPAAPVAFAAGAASSADPHGPILSDWLVALHASPGQAQLPLVSLYSKHDNIIAPAGSCVVDGALNIDFIGIGHVALGSHPAVLARLMALLSEGIDSAPDDAPVPAQAATSIQEKPSC